ncbi:hypothetical protein [Solidesulfovibrio sp. C21]|uniref:hypothetical protein n=1 Tax=Solidesulfovibrio sp. C21 TaxID=3398613 RepID=UPI0039FD4139
MPKKFAYFVILASVLLGFVETVSYVSYLLVFRKPLSFSAIASQNNVVINSYLNEKNDPSSQRSYLIDPYFGYVSKTDQETEHGPNVINAARTFGFDTAGQLIPDYPDKVFTVAILGGSVAKYFAANMGEVLRQYVERLPEAQGKQIVILGLGNYSYKEPQQLNIVNDFLAQGARFDIVVNIDGFNEVAHPGVHNLPNRVSPFFPSGWSDRTGEVASNEDLAVLGKMTLLQHVRVHLAKAYQDFGLGLTSATLWSVIDQLLANRLYALEASRLGRRDHDKPAVGNFLSLSPSGKIFFGSHRDYPASELYPDLAVHWAFASALINNAVVASGGRYYHFLQPNQYDKGSKPINSEEKQIAIDDSPYRVGVEEGYDLLRKAGKELVANSLYFTDTSNIFQDHNETLYMDDCCHYNKDGEKLLAHRIGQTLVDTNNARQQVVDIEKLREQLDLVVENVGKTQRLAAISRDLVGNDADADVTVTGLWGTEENAERRFRWGIGPSTVVTVFAPRHARIHVAVQCLSATPDQTLLVVANGKELARWNDIAYVGTATDLSRHDVALKAKPGRNTVELRYATWLGDKMHPALPHDQRKMAVMFQSFQVETMPALEGIR